MTDSMNYGINVSSFFHADWQIDNDFLTGQSRCVLKSWHTGEGPEQGFWCCFTDGLLRQKLKPELSLPVVLATIQGLKQWPGRCQSCCLVEHDFARTPPVFGRSNATVITFCNSEPRLHSKPFFYQKTNWILVSLATKLQIKSFTILHHRSSLADMEWLCKPFVNITWGKINIVKILHFGNPHIVHFVQVKHAKYNESQRFQSISN